MQPLEIAKGNPTAIPRAEDDDAGLASSTWTATAATDELNGDRLSSTEAVSRRRSNDNNISRNNTNNNTTIPDSPRSFDSNELFEDVLDETIGEYGMDRITDDDLERLMWNSDEGQRNYRRHQQNNSNTNRSSFIFQQYHQIRSWLCPCCPPRHHKIGNMIILLPYYCVTKFKCGIMGPHWFGPVACFTLLSGATSRLVPRSYRTIGPITGQICLGLYLVSVLLLGLVVCRDPGVVRSTAMMEDEEEQVEQENVGEDEGTDGIAGRVESGRSGGRSGRGRGLTGRGSGGGQLEAARVSNTNGNRRRGAGDGWRYCDICRYGFYASSLLFLHCILID